MWPRAVRRYAAPDTQERIQVVSLEWLLPHSRRGPETALAILRIARKHCPAALPRRFGEFEPLQGRLDRDGDDGFAAAWATADASYAPLLFWKATAPCFGGSGSPVGLRPQPQRPVIIDISFDSRALKDSTWREATARFFDAMANELEAFAGAALIETNWLAERGRLWSDRQTGTASLHVNGEWKGWRQVPAWLLWFGPPYQARLVGALAGLTVHYRSRGVLLRTADAPGAAESSWPRLPEEICARQGGGRWAPAQWLPRIEAGEHSAGPNHGPGTEATAQ